MPMKSAIETELRKATGSKAQGRTESRQGFLARVTQAVGELTDAEWNELTEPTQHWVNAAVKAGKNKIPDFPDVDPPEDEQEPEGAEDDQEAVAGEEADDEPEEEAPRKRTAKKAAPPAKKKADDGDGSQTEGVKVLIKRHLLQDPKATVDDVVSVIEKAGVTASRLTVAGIRAEFRHTLRFLKAEGALKNNKIEV